MHSSIATILAQMLPRKQAIKMYFIFPPDLTSASALLGEQETWKLRLFTYMPHAFSPKNMKRSLKISPGQN